MPDDTEGHEKKTDDLFEDLDKFFAPIRDVDWPEEGEEGAAPKEQEGARAAGSGDATAEHEAPGTAPPGDETALHEAPGAPRGGGETVEAPTMSRGTGEEPQEELLPTDWAAGLDVGEPAEPAAEGPGRGALGPDEGEHSRYLGQPTEEMSGEDWEELRARFGPDQPLDVVEDDEDETARPGEPEPYSFLDQFLPPEGQEPAAAPPSEPQPAVTIDDLRKAPDAYRDLPVPPDEDEEPAHGAAASAADEDEEEPYGVAAGPMGEEEPPPEAVEAAAEHFAESIRQSGELPVIEPEPFEPAAGGPVEDDLLTGLDEEPRGPRTVRVGVSDTVGPSWQDPTMEEVAGEGEVEPARGGRNIPLAFLSGLVLAIIGVGSIAISKAAFAVVATIVVLLAQLELYTALRRRGYQPAIPLGLVMGALTMAAAYLKGEGAMLAMVPLAVVFTFLWYMAVPAPHRKNVLANVGLTLFPYIYVAVLAGYIAIILALPGKVLVLSVLALAVGYDIAAFAGGSMFGSRPLAPSISPRKSWEGVVTATLVLLVVAVAILASIDPISTLGRAIGLALVAAVFAPLGDLAESLLKRDLGVKDLGSIMPGHGGALDRIDSILFVAPAAFYFIRIVFF